MAICCKEDYNNVYLQLTENQLVYGENNIG